MTNNEEGETENQETNENAQNINTEKLSKLLEPVSAKNFTGLLQNLQYTWVKVNQKGPESAEGLLVDSDENFVLLANKEDLYRLPIFHIKSLSVKVENQDDSDQEENEEQNNEQQSNQNNQNNNSNDNNNQNNNKNNNENNKQNKKVKGNPWDGVTVQFVNKNKKQNNNRNRNSGNSKNKK